MPKSYSLTYEYLKWLLTEYVPIAGAETPEGGDGGDGGGEGQGDEGESGLYDLSSVPEELRPHLEPHLKAMEGNATKKFQEHAQFRDQWQPYEELGISNYDPQVLGQLLEFAEMASDEDAFRTWVGDVAQELGLFEESGGAGDSELFDPDLGDEGLGGMSEDEVRQMIAETVQEAINPVYENLTAQEQQQAVAQARQDIENQLNALEEEHGSDSFDREAVLAFAYAHSDTDADPIARGFEDFQRVVGNGQSKMFDQKRNQPAPAEGAGAPNTTPERITSFDQAGAAARERFAQSRAT